MEDAVVVASIKSLYEKRKQIITLSNQRRAEEEALVLEYKVAECNIKRNELVTRYSGLINTVQAEIHAIEASLGE